MKKTIYSSLAACLILSAPILMTELTAETSIIRTTIQVDQRITNPNKRPRATRINYSNKSKQADLVITEIKKMGRVRSSRVDHRIGVPIRITIKNKGKQTARRFKVATEIFNPSLERYSFIEFHAPGYSSSRPTVKVNLRPGQSTSIYGKLLFSSRFRGTNIRVRAKADDCRRGEGYRRPSCRVRESNERNNYSGNARIIIPR